MELTKTYYPRSPGEIEQVILSLTREEAYAVIASLASQLAMDNKGYTGGPDTSRGGGIYRVGEIPRASEKWEVPSPPRDIPVSVVIRRDPK